MERILSALATYGQFDKLWLKHGQLFCQRKGGEPMWVEYNPGGFYVVYVGRDPVFSSEYQTAVVKKLTSLF